MPKQENKATVRNQGLEDAFRQGFDEGMRQAAGAQIIYELEATFEGTMLRTVQHSDLDRCLEEAREMLIHGHGSDVRIRAIAVPTPQEQGARAVTPGVTVSDEPIQVADDENIEDAEVVYDEEPSQES